MNNSLLEYKITLKDCLIGIFLASSYIFGVFGALMFSQ
jgi:hypothetical protein